MDSENVQRLKDEVETMLPKIIFSSSNLDEVLKKHAVSETFEVEVKMSLNGHQLRTLQARKCFLTTCPTGDHRDGGCVHDC